jgi:hypothetical protein
MLLMELNNLGLRRKSQISENLRNWSRYPDNPVLGNRPLWYDADMASDPKVFRGNGQCSTLEMVVEAPVSCMLHLRTAGALDC